MWHRDRHQLETLNDVPRNPQAIMRRAADINASPLIVGYGSEKPS
jgi:hypothetical protein